MAKKVSHPKDKAAEQAAEDAAIINPNRGLALGGVDVVVKEYPFFEYEEKIAQSQHTINLIDALAGLLGGGSEIFWDDVLAILGKNGAAVRFLVSISIDQPEEFIAGLTNAEIELLLIQWWMCNKHFFIRSAGRQLREQKRLASQPVGPTSSSA